MYIMIYKNKAQKIIKIREGMTTSGKMPSQEQAILYEVAHYWHSGKNTNCNSLNYYYFFS